MSDRREAMADVVIQLVGLASALVGSVVLLSLSFDSRSGVTVAATAVYGGSLLAMFVCSILNALATEPVRKARLRALDHVVIYVLIAGTYTPFCLLVIGGVHGWALLAAVWAAALAGVFSRLIFHRWVAKARITLYVLLGWSGLVAGLPVFDRLPVLGTVFLVVGGLIYSVAAPLHRWTTLRYHNALWHGCVVAAACCHYGAVFLAVTGSPIA